MCSQDTLLQHTATPYNILQHTTLHHTALHSTTQATEVTEQVGLTDFLTSRPDVAHYLAPLLSGNVFLFAVRDMCDMTHSYVWYDSFICVA